MFAIGLRLAAVAILSVMLTFVKLLADRHVHIVEQLFYRQLIALPVVFAVICATQGPRAVMTGQIHKHVARTALGLTGMSFNFGSYILLPMAQATAVGFSTPIFGTILSALMLREVTGWHRWSAVLLGFVGVMVIVNPESGMPLFGASVAIIAAILNAFIAIMLRYMGRTESAGQTVFWFTLLSLPPLGIGMIFFAQAHDPLTWALMAGMGVTGGIAQICLTGSLRWAPVSVVLPMDYSTILWTALFGWFFWNDLPTATMWLGAALIIASGLYIAWREHARNRPVQTPMVEGVD